LFKAGQWGDNPGNLRRAEGFLAGSSWCGATPEVE